MQASVMWVAMAAHMQNRDHARGPRRSPVTPRRGARSALLRTDYAAQSNA
jgi:hypothetical protein